MITTPSAPSSNPTLSSAPSSDPDDVNVPSVLLFTSSVIVYLGITYYGFRVLVIDREVEERSGKRSFLRSIISSSTVASICFMVSSTLLIINRSTIISDGSVVEIVRLVVLLLGLAANGNSLFCTTVQSIQ